MHLIDRDGRLTVLPTRAFGHPFAVAPVVIGQPVHDRCGFRRLLVGEPGSKGDPLTHPRLMIRVMAEFIPRDSADHPAIRAHWLQAHPKAKLYVDFADFAFVRLRPLSALLNGGFARAFRLAPEDLLPPA